MHSKSSNSLPTDLLILGAFACLCAAYLSWGWSHEISDFQGDSSGYMLAAQYFSPFHAITPLLTEYSQRIIYPPLFPIVIGLFGGSLLAGHLVVIASLLGAFLCLYLWLRAEKLSTAVSAMAVVAFALMPGTYLQALNIWTENTFLLFSLLAFVLVCHAEEPNESNSKLWWLAALVVSCGILVRVAGLPLFVAFALRVLLARPARWPGLIVAAGGPFAAWVIWSKFHQAGIGGYTSQWATLYANDWLHVLIVQLQQESFALLRAWDQSWLNNASAAPLHWLILAIACICLIGWLVRLRKLTFDALYVLVYGLLLLAWPHPEEARRYGYVLIPILIGQGALLLQTLANKSSGSLKNTLPVLVLVGATITTIPSLLLTISRFTANAAPNLEAARRTEWWYESDRRDAEFKSRYLAYTMADMRHLAELVPPSECIFSTKPSIVMLYSERMAYVPPNASTSDTDFNEGIKRCKFAYLIAITSPTYPSPLYPAARLPNRLNMLSVVRDKGAEGKPMVFSALGEITQ